jgi:hypothetical protein
VTFSTDSGANCFYIAAPINLNKGINMKCNAGGIDRALRIIVGLVLVALAATGTVGMWGWIGVVPLLTGAIGFCPAYTLLGVNSCSIKK